MPAIEWTYESEFGRHVRFILAVDLRTRPLAVNGNGFAILELIGTNMELKNFVANSLIEIIHGVKNAQEREPKNIGIRINKTEDVEFDVAVTVTKGKEGNVGGGINIVAEKIDGEEKFSKEEQSVSRIKFAVPLTYDPAPERGKRHQEANKLVDEYNNKRISDKRISEIIKGEPAD